MTNPEALAKLIYNAPKLAGEVMPEGCAFGDDRVGGQFRYAITHTTPDGRLFLFPDGVDAPDWFYQAVAGKLAEWLARKGYYAVPGTKVINSRMTDGWWVYRYLNQVVFVGDTTYFAALVEAAIAVHNAA